MRSIRLFLTLAFLMLASVTILAQSMGPLVQSTNTNFFKRPDGRTIVLAGSHTWDDTQDTSESSSIPEAFDFNAFVTFLQTHGHNATILWHKDLPKYCGWGADGGGTTWFMANFPWPRNGGAGAGDGGQKFDLSVTGGVNAPVMATSSINQPFFDAIKARVEALGAAHIYAIVELFDGLGITDNRCGGNTDGYPFSSGNNINGIADDNAQNSMTMTSANQTVNQQNILAVQEAYVKKMIDTLNAEPNVIWEISEEAPGNGKGGDSTWWQNFMISLVHTYEQGGTFSQAGKTDETFSAKTFRHPVLYPTLNVELSQNDSIMLNSNAESVSLFGASHVVGTTKCGTGSPACKVSITDSDHNYFGTMWTDTQQAVRNAIWENFANGNSYVYMDPYLIWWPTNNRNLCNGGVRPTNAVCTTIVSTSSGWQENVRRTLGFIANYGNVRMNLTNTTPQPTLSTTGFVLANDIAGPGGEYMVYAPSGGTFTVNLSKQNGFKVHVEWMDTITGKVYQQPPYAATSSTTQSFAVPSQVTSPDAVLLLKVLPWNNVLAPARAVDWTLAGVPGGIPSSQWGNCVAAACTTLWNGGVDGAQVTAANINLAVTAAVSDSTCQPSGGCVVRVPAGTHTLTTSIQLASNVVVRGQGANQTFFTFSGASQCGFVADVCLSTGIPGFPSGEQNMCDWQSAGGTSGVYTQGATTIALINCGTTTPALGAITSLKVGSLIALDQLDETADTGNIWNCLNSGTEGGPQCSDNGTGAGGGARFDGTTIPCATCTGGVMKYRSQQQVVQVVSCDGNSTVGHACTNTGSSGNNTIIVDPPIYMPNWNTGQKPQAFYFTNYMSNAGIENVSINNCSGTVSGPDASGNFTCSAWAGNHNVIIGACIGCWVKGVRAMWPGRSSVVLGMTRHSEVRDSYLYQGTGHSSVSYAIELYYTSDDNKIENNISQQVTDSMPNCNGGCEGNVFAYNFSIDDVYVGTDFFQPSLYLHASGTAMNLWEGNVSSGFAADLVHGTHALDTLFRNRLYGYQTAGCGGAGSLNTCAQQTVAIHLLAGSRYFNVVGNVLGQSGYHTAYQCIGSGSCPSSFPVTGHDTQVYELGYSHSLGFNNNSLNFYCTTPSCTATTNFDAQVMSTLMRWGNWDVVSSSNVNSTNDLTGIHFLSAENGSAAALYPALASPVQTLAGSFYNTSGQPSWWQFPNGTTSPYPNVGPDVTSGNLSASGGHAYQNPAQNCFLNVMGGPANGSGSVLNFNADTCYSGVASLAAVASINPTSLTFANQLVGTTSSTQLVTLTNIGSATMNISQITINGDFGISSTSCGATLAVNVSCNINVNFTPTQAGNRLGTLFIFSNASNGTQQVSLSGTGFTNTPGVGFSPTSLTFLSQAVGTTSAAQQVTVTSTGTANLTLTSISLAGTNPGDFAQSNNCPLSPSSMAPGATCTISVTFTPLASGSRSATVSVVGNASGTIPLGGTGTQATPSQVTGLLAHFLGGAKYLVSLSWNPAALATFYNIYRSPTSGGPYVLVGVSASTSFIDGSILYDTLYYYIVRGADTAGEGPSSAEVSVHIPKAPVGVFSRLNRPTGVRAWR